MTVSNRMKRVPGLNRQRHEASQHARHLHDGEQFLVVARPGQLHGQVQRFVQQVGERVALIDGERREDGKNLAAERLGRELPVGLVEIALALDDDALFAEGGQHFAFERGILMQKQFIDVRRDLFKLRPWRHPVGPARTGDAGRDFLLQAADADHEEFVEVRGEDRQKLDALEQRHVRVAGLVEDAAVEFEPRQITVDVERRVVQIDRGRVASHAHSLALPSQEGILCRRPPMGHGPTAAKDKVSQSSKSTGRKSCAGSAPFPTSLGRPPSPA